MHDHVFDPVSGWCTRCTYREDGRLMGPGGQEFRAGREYTPAELEEIRQKALTR